MNFTEALKALEQDQMVRRSVWPDDQFVFKQIPASIPYGTIPKMQSLPECVKDELIARLNHSQDLDSIYYHDQYCLVHSGNLITSWVPNTMDLAAVDWNTTG